MKKTILLLFLAFVYVNAFCYSVGTPATPNTNNEYVISKAPAQSVTESNVDSATMLKTMEKITPEQKKQLEENIWGKGLTIYDYIPAFLFAFLGMFLRWYWTARKGVKNDKNESPTYFSLKYWIKDNALPKLNTLLASIVIIFIGLRFSNEVLSFNFSMFLALLIGLSIDYVSDILKNLKPVKTNN